MGISSSLQCRCMTGTEVCEVPDVVDNFLARVAVAKMEATLPPAEVAAPAEAAPPSAVPEDMSDSESVASDLSLASGISLTSSIGGSQQQSALTNFVRVLARGRPVTLVKACAYDPFVERRLAKMQLQKNLKTLTIVSADINITLSVCDITEVYTVEADGQEQFPKEIVKHLTPTEIDSLARVFHKLPDGRVMACCLLEARPKWRKLLLLTLKALIKRAMKQDRRAKEGGLTAAALDAANAAAGPQDKLMLQRGLTPRGGEQPRARQGQGLSRGGRELPRASSRELAGASSEA